MMRPPRAPLVAFSLLGAAALGSCTSASFEPRSVRRAEAAGTSAQIERARVNPSGWLRVSTRFEKAEGIRLHEARLVLAREPVCGKGGALAHAGEFRQQAAPRWERPLPIPEGSTLDLAFGDYDQAFTSPTALELDLESPRGRGCLRLPMSGPGDPLAWQPATAAPSLGLRLYADLQAAALLARIGLHTRSFLHALELGVGWGGESAMLGTSPALAFGVSSERTIWRAWSHGLLSASVEIGYQARLAMERPAAGRPRLIHGPRIGIRPVVLTAPSPPLLPIGQRFGSFAMFELFIATWMSGYVSNPDVMLGIAFTWDTPLPH